MSRVQTVSRWFAKLTVRSVSLALVAVLFAACGSSQIKTRKEQRDKVAQASHLYCEFINGETYPDVDVAMNIEMAKHCDSNGQMSITGYHSPSDAVGLVYCCSLKEDGVQKESKKADTEKK